VRAEPSFADARQVQVVLDAMTHPMRWAGAVMRHGDARPPVTGRPGL
jgi:hypothetical protein